MCYIVFLNVFLIVFFLKVGTLCWKVDTNNVLVSKINALAHMHKVLCWASRRNPRPAFFQCQLLSKGPGGGIRARRATTGACYVNCLSGDWIQSAGILVRGI